MKETSSKILAEKANRIKWLFTDVDGTLTDGTVYFSAEGEALKSFSLRDGTGFFLLRAIGVKVGIITGEDSPIVRKRAEKLNADALLMNAVPKVETLSQFINSQNISFDEVAYIGDDLNDIKLMQMCGLTFAVNDASPYVKSIVDIVCDNNGGDGAFREAVEKLLSYKKVNITEIVKKYL
jgi:YrbI family 3-deoxy-D-manno-octulosonate 8-phosphate phosphatase